MRGRARVHGRRAVVVHLDLGGLARGAVGGGDFHVRGQAEAEQLGLAGLDAALLLGAQLVVAGRIEYLVERRLVVAGVVRRARLGNERELLRLDEVQLAHHDRVQARLGGVPVDDPLDRRGSLRPASAAVSGDRRAVGDDRLVRGLHGRDVVHAGCHQVGEHRQEAAHAGVPAGVLHDVEAVRLDVTFAVAAELDVVQLGAALGHRHQVLVAGLDPAHGTAGVLGRPGDKDLLAVHADLRAEAAAHVRGDHADRVRRQPDRGQDQPGELRVLG